jgi:hypothetical protein
MVAQVFGIFESGDDFALEAAASLSILAEKSGDDVLSKANHAVVKVIVLRDWPPAHVNGFALNPGFLSVRLWHDKRCSIPSSRSL